MTVKVWAGYAPANQIVQINDEDYGKGFSYLGDSPVTLEEFNWLFNTITNEINTIGAAQVGGTIGFLTKATMDADLAHAENTLALVTNDLDNANNGNYIKTGASGTGSWQKAAGTLFVNDDLPVFSNTYNSDGTVATITEGSIIYALTYNADKSVDTVSNGSKTIKCQYSNGRFSGTILL